MGVTVRGARAVAESLQDAGTDLGRLKAAHAEAGKLIVDACQPPRLTGRLAGSIRAVAENERVTVGSDLVYAGVQEARSHYLREAFTRTQSRQLDVYTRAVQRVCDDVRGA